MSAPAAVRAQRGPGGGSGRTRAEARNGLPVDADLSRPLPQRMLHSKLAWLTFVVLCGYAVCLVLLYRQVVPDQQVPGGVLPGLGKEALPIAARYALITAVPLSLLFLWADRFRPQRFWVWLMTFGWGACVATYVAAGINTWAASHLSIAGDGDPATGARAAIFVAPFVEEASKATVLFWLAILMRYQWVSRLSGIVLAGLSGAAFAFVENILYYGRAYRYAARTIGSVSPEQALHQTFVVRGLMTFFGHPLFTSFTGIGLAVAMRARSKTVRVVAPLAGFCCAAFLHMSFNTVASILPEQQALMVFVFVAIPLVLAFVAFVVRQLFAEGRLIRTRLGDYVRTGWLEPGDPVALSRLRTRLRALWHAAFTGPTTFVATIRMQRAVTEIAYLRDSMNRGLVDATGHVRERTLLATVRTVRPQAVVTPTGPTPYPWLRRRRRAERAAATSQGPGYPLPSYPGPAGLGGSYPAPGTPAGASGALGQTATRYSEVDPSWKPPGE